MRRGPPFPLLASSLSDVLVCAPVRPASALLYDKLPPQASPHTCPCHLQSWAIPAPAVHLNHDFDKPASVVKLHLFSCLSLWRGQGSPLAFFRWRRYHAALPFIGKKPHARGERKQHKVSFMIFGCAAMQGFDKVWRFMFKHLGMQQLTFLSTAWRPLRPNLHLYFSSLFFFFFKFFFKY